MWAGVISTAAPVVFDAGHIALSFSGFTALTDATLPVGALDNDWYRVSVGGYFHGTTTTEGQTVKLISGKADLIVVPESACCLFRPIPRHLGHVLRLFRPGCTTE